MSYVKVKQQYIDLFKDLLIKLVLALMIVVAILGVFIGLFSLYMNPDNIVVVFLSSFAVSASLCALLTFLVGANRKYEIVEVVEE